MKLSLTILVEQWNLLYASTGSSMNYYQKSHGFYRSVRFLSPQIQALQKETLYILSSPTEKLNHLIQTAAPSSAMLCILPSLESSLYDTYHFSSEILLDYASVTGCVAEEALNRILLIYEKYDDYDARFLQALSESSPLQKLLDIICELIGNPSYIADRNFRALAIDHNPDLPFYSINWKRVCEHGYLPFHVVSSIMNNVQWKDMETAIAPQYMRTKEFSTAFLMLNLRTGNHKVQWRLFVCELLKKITPADQDLVQCISEYLLRCLSSDLKYHTLPEKNYEPFLREIASGSLHSRQFIEEQLRPLHWNINECYFLLEIMAETCDGYLREYLENEMEKLGDSLLFFYEERIFVIFHLSDADNYNKICTSLSEFFSHMDQYGAVSNCFYGFERLSDYVKQTERLIRLSAHLSDDKKMILYQDFYMKDILLQLKKEISLSTLIPWELQKLTEYDKTHHASLCHTLHQYLRLNQNLVVTSQILHIHRNTLVYRLEKIRQLIGDVFPDPDKCTQLLFINELISE